MTAASSIPRVQPLAWSWVRTAGDCRLGMTGFVGLYRDRAPTDQDNTFVVQSVISGNGRTVRQHRLRFKKLSAATRHFRSMSAFIANDRRAMRIVGEARVKLPEAA